MEHLSRHQDSSQYEQGPPQNRRSNEEEHPNKDNDNNVFIGDNIVSQDSENNLIVSSKDKLIVIEGVNDVFVLDTDDALLVCHKDREQEVKSIVNRIKANYKGKYN